MPSYAYYDHDADIVWVPTGYAERVVSEETSWGTIDHDEITDDVVAIEIRNASSRLPAVLLGVLRGPNSQDGSTRPED